MNIEAQGDPACRSLTVGAVVLHYRFWPGVRATLDSLLTQSHPPDRVVIVDNGSGNEVLEQLRAAYPGLKYAKASENLGYAAGMNLGMRALEGDRVDAFLLLTHECVLAPDCVEKLIARMAQNPAVGAAGPLLRSLNRREIVWSAGGEIDPRTSLPVHRGAGDEIQEWANRAPEPVEWLDGACILLRKQAAAEAGALDERYFLYFEDVEYGARLRRLGWEIECVPTAVAAQASSPLPIYLSVRNRLGFLAAAAPRSRLAAEVRRLALNLGRDLLRPPKAPQRADLPERIRGFFDFFRGRWGPPNS